MVEQMDNSQIFYVYSACNSIRHFHLYFLFDSISVHKTRVFLISFYFSIHSAMQRIVYSLFPFPEYSLSCHQCFGHAAIGKCNTICTMSVMFA